MKSLLILIATLFTLNLQAAQTPNGTYKLDKAHAHIGFKISHLGFSHTFGRFNTFDGYVVYEADGATNINFAIETKSIDTNNKKRDKHLRSADFFDTEVFDTITFKSTELTYADGDPSSITGLLTMKGVEKSMSFEVKAIGAGTSKGKNKAGYEAKATINRSDYDMGGWSSLGEEVEITINLEMELVK